MFPATLKLVYQGSGTTQVDHTVLLGHLAAVEAHSHRPMYPQNTGHFMGRMQLSFTLAQNGRINKETKLSIQLFIGDPLPFH